MAKARQTINLTVTELYEAVYKSIKDLGGSATNDEIVSGVISQLNLSDKVIDEPHDEKGRQTELEYQINWAKTYLRTYGALENSSRGVWSITSKFSSIDSIKNDDVNAFMDALRKKKYPAKSKTEKDDKKEEIVSSEIDNEQNVSETVTENSWKDKLAEILQNMNPYGFESLVGRLLRECGFIDVKVTKKSGDGGIDGIGKLKINGFLSFNVAFQCKRYKGSVGSPEIQAFRGSLSTDIEKGIFITTGLFTKQAKEEASTPGKKQIDLIDGNDLMDKLAELQLGLEEVKTYKIKTEFFEQFNK